MIHLPRLPDQWILARKPAVISVSEVSAMIGERTWPVITASVVMSAVLQMLDRKDVIAVGYLLVVMLVFMSLHVVTTYYVLPDAGRKLYNWDQEITTKVFLLLLMPVSAFIDVAIYVAATLLPGDFPVLEQGNLLVTNTTMLWLTASHALKVVANVRARGGSEFVSPVLAGTLGAIQWVIMTMRQVDKERWTKYGKADSEPPHRWTDGLRPDMTDQEILEYMQKAREGMPPEHPEKEGAK